MKKTTTWVVVADGAHAKFFANEGPSRGLVEIPNLELSQERHRTSDMVSDKRGRYSNEAGGGRHAFDPKEDLQHHVEHSFATKIIHELDQAAERKEFDRLVLVAPPKMLGEMRAVLPKRLKSKLAADLDRDLVRATAAELVEHLGDRLAL